jgi:hypothetical protein
MDYPEAIRTCGPFTIMVGRMFCKTILVLALLTVSQSLIGSAVAAEPAFYFAPRTVVLNGKIVIDRYFVPSDFEGNPKTNSNIAAPVLILQKPISVKEVGEPEPSKGSWRFGITRIQIVPLINYEALCGRLVQVEGMLAEGNENFETRVTLTISRIISQQADGTCVTNDHTVSHEKPN